jgi:CTP synthase (UTP-ammonia lyase)
VLGFRDADHAETSPDAHRLVVTALSCSLVGQQQRVILRPETRAARLYGAAEVMEDYYCNYGVNPEYHGLLEDGGLRVSGVGEAGEVRIVELPGHPFFLSTLFLPQARSTPDQPHPLLAGYAAAVLGKTAS